MKVLKRRIIAWGVERWVIILEDIVPRIDLPLLGSRFFRLNTITENPDLCYLWANAVTGHVLCAVNPPKFQYLNVPQHLGGLNTSFRPLRSPESSSKMSGKAQLVQTIQENSQFKTPIIWVCSTLDLSIRTTPQRTNLVLVEQLVAYQILDKLLTWASEVMEFVQLLSEIAIHNR